MWDVNWLQTDPAAHASELEYLEAMVRGGNKAVLKDSGTLARCTRRLKGAYVFLTMAPFAGAVALALTSLQVPNFRP